MSTPSQYAIELRDNEFNLKKRLEPFVQSCNWEWNAIGGCGRATIKVAGDYRRFEAEADDDIQIYLKTLGLVYRGYVEDVVPSLMGSDESITLNCYGYWGWLDRLIVHDEGDEKFYYSQEISAIVDDLIDTFIVANTSITRGTTEESSITPDVLAFKGKVRECIDTLIDLVGNIECGVDENLQFYWYNRVKDFKDRFYLGDKVIKISDRVDYRNIVNQIYFEGGDVDGSAFRTSGGSTRSQSKYGIFQEIISNGSIITSSTANQLISAILKQRARPQKQTSISVDNIARRLESRFPMGAIAVVDPAAYQDGLKYGTTANGGSNVLYGRTRNGGDNKKYGTTPRLQVDRIRYSLSPEDARIDAEIQFGNSLSVSRASAEMKRIESNLNAVRQRSL